MRPDVKLGLIVSMVSVFVAGGYFFYRGESETPIEVASSPSDLVASATTDRQAQSNSGPISHADPRARKPSIGGGASTKDSRQDQARASGRRPTAMETAQPRTQGQARRVFGTGRQAPQRSKPETQTNAQRSGRSAALAQRSRTSGQQQREVRPPVKRRAKQQLALTGTKPPTGRAATSETAVEKHRVQDGDTFSSLANQYYGAARFARFLIDSNSQVGDPDHLRVGEVVKIPPRPDYSALRKPSPTTRTARQTGRAAPTYRVKAGDSFYRIARDVLGDASRWRELFELNKELVGGDPTHLQVGQLVKLPSP